MSKPSRAGFSLILLAALVSSPARAQCDPAARPFPLPHLDAALASHALSLLVLAPMSQYGADTGRDDGSLAFRIEAALRAQRPDLAIDLDTMDNAGQTVAEMLPALAGRLAHTPVSLVVWQAGTAEIFRAVPVATASAALADAVHLLAINDADLILIDPDPSLDPEPQYRQVETSLAQTALREGVALYQQRSGGDCTSHGVARLIARP